MSLNPFVSAVIAFIYALKGRLHFPKERIGDTVVMDDGVRFTIFRQVIVDPEKSRSRSPGATFIVRFHVAGMKPEQNKKFSWIPMFFILGLPGFRSKLWTLDESTGDFQGIYEWDTVKDAENYAGSFAMRFMTGRSTPGSVSYRIIPK
ncbi:hypothetical protein CUJ83_06705 [Methanocella sp. CWC-04]|uniref:Uncharacterized protein n=1 Tax=Methanooceanicella nereidis TaxID=2052831 RepID=A0AAP2W6X4_9EURY|nr:YdhR family protein [Methanocella sp. CWC-04]MCD1294689.1 hypothetical protein [Methanocella sp. CWC-04]